EDALRVAVAGEIHAQLLPRRHAGEGARVAPIVLEVQDGHRLRAAVGAGDLEVVQRVRVAVGEGAQEHGVDHAEDGRARADAQAERHQGQGEEPRPGGERTDRGANVGGDHATGLGPGPRVDNGRRLTETYDRGSQVTVPRSVVAARIADARAAAVDRHPA